jgi:putative drug exporter of the RND superfamily
VVAWILALIIIIPLLGGLGKVTSLQQGSASGNQLESIRAADIITAQFQKTVPNSTLLIVVSTKNASSIATQQTVAQITGELKSNKTIVGLQSSVDVYSTFYSILKGINRGVYSTQDFANATTELLLGVPALYYGAWLYANATGHNAAISNKIAYVQTNTTLYKANATAYALYSSHVLNIFNVTWVTSWQYQPNITPFSRAASAASITDQKYLSFYPANLKAFGEGLLSAVTFTDFVNFSSTVPARLSAFALQVVTTTSLLSPVLVNAAYSLGRSYSNSSLYGLTGKIIWSPQSYGVRGPLASLIGSFVSPSRDTTLIALGLNESSTSNLLAIRSIVSSSLASQGAGSDVQAALVTGGDALNYDIGKSTQSDLGIILPVTIILLILATGIFFRSALTPFITLSTIGVALGISQIFILLVGLYIAKVDFTIPTILLTVLIGVGTDYSIFVIARYREERVRGLSVEDAVQTSVTWAGESIATSGATVIISFLALGFTSIVFLQTMGIVVGLGVLVALFVALTLVPAIVTFIGGRTFWPNSGERFARYATSVKSKLQAKRGYFSRSGGFAVKHAKLLILMALIISIPTLYVYATSTPTYNFLGGAATNLESIKASTQLQSSFGGGRLFPTYVVVRFNNALVNGFYFNGQEMTVLSQISSYLLGNPDIENVTGPTRPFGGSVSYANLNSSNLGDRATFAAIMQSVGKNNATALITANFRIDPYSTQAINDASTIRSYLHQNFDQAPAVSQLLVGGASGSILDTKNVFGSQFGSVLPIVVLGVAIVLFLVLGSLFLPVFAVISVLMSIVWTLAVTQLVFQSYFNYQILFIIPLFLFVTLLGLGMDYNIFILTRIREEATKGENLNECIIHAIEQTGGIITAAAIILAGSLGALMLSGNLLLKELGFAFSFSILLDALVVRTYLVPAVMSLMKKWNWYNPIGFLHRSKSLYESGNQ